MTNQTSALIRDWIVGQLLFLAAAVDPDEETKIFILQSTKSWAIKKREILK